jgi:hypothetical protein
MKKKYLLMIIRRKRKIHKHKPNLDPEEIKEIKLEKINIKRVSYYLFRNFFGIIDLLMIRYLTFFNQKVIEQ